MTNINNNNAALADKFKFCVWDKNLCIAKGNNPVSSIHTSLFINAHKNAGELPFPWETSGRFWATCLMRRQERTEGGRFWRAEGLSSRLLSGHRRRGPAPLRAAGAASPASRPSSSPGQQAAPGVQATGKQRGLFPEKKRPVSAARALHHMRLLVERAGRGARSQSPGILGLAPKASTRPL